jgi:hypothetical protein
MGTFDIHNLGEGENFVIIATTLFWTFSEIIDSYKSVWRP